MLVSAGIGNILPLPPNIYFTPLATDVGQSMFTIILIIISFTAFA